MSKLSFSCVHANFSHFYFGIFSVRIFRYLLTLASHLQVSFFSKFLQHHCHILDYRKLFFWEHSYCSFVKKHHQKHEHTSHDSWYLYWCHCLPTAGISRNFYVFHLYLVERSFYVFHYSNIFSKSHKYSNELVHEIRTSHKISIYWFSTNFWRIVKNYSDFVRFVGIEDTVMTFVFPNGAGHVDFLAYPFASMSSINVWKCCK